ncbi:hypothetical protein BJV74DRAFT_871449 [Russula compacta]|nr:hypothetical protein BJV74DRAFT_871449 [Russula compacta]
MHDVLSIKVDFLRSITPADALLPRHPDDDDGLEASNDDEREIKSLFPSTLRFLDLSVLELEEKVTNRLPLPLLLREEYDYLSELIKKQPRNCGQPGTGKTAYLHLRIIEKMIEGCSFLYQGRNQTVYHVAENGVEAINSWSSEETVVAFVDGDLGSCGPQSFLLCKPVQLVVASFPQGAYQKWTKQAGHGSFIFTFAVKLWSLDELFLTGIFLYPYDLSFKLLRKSTSYFGYNPRQCFEASLSVRALWLKKMEAMRRIRGAAFQGSDHIVRLLVNILASDGCDVSQEIFQISPRETDCLPYLPGCKSEAVSSWVLDLLLQQLNALQANDAAKFYYKISTQPEEASLRGHLFERQALNYLGGIGVGVERKFSIRGLTDSSQMPWAYQGPIRRFAFEEFTVIEQITNAFQNKEPLYMVPLVCDSLAVDSILYDPNDPNAVLTCIQVTRNEKHTIAVSGLRHIQSWFEPCGPLADLRASKSKPWRFLFVVPLGRMPTFKLQELDGDTTGGEWAGKVHQYVLGLDEQSVFGKRPN